MKEEKKRDLTEMFMELKDRIRGRLEFVSKLGLPEDETKLMVKENELFLKIIDKVIDHKIKPIQTIETVRGTQYKIGDKFCINGNVNTKYVIQYFPDSVTVRGVCKNPEIGQSWTVEAYIEDIFKPQKEKPVEVKEEKRKPVEIKVGEYFATRTNNTVYKAIRVKEKQVFGSNGLDKQNFIGVFKTDIILKKKKDYKKQHKAQKNYKE